MLAGLLLLQIVLVMISSCAKTKSDPFDPIVGGFSGILTDSDIVTHQVTIHTGYPLTINKLTSSRIGLGSDSMGLQDFYADIAASGADFAGTIPGQSVDTINIQGATGLGLPTGTSIQFVSASKQLNFVLKYSYTNSSVRGRILTYQVRSCNYLLSGAASHGTSS